MHLTSLWLEFESDGFVFGVGGAFGWVLIGGLLAGLLEAGELFVGPVITLLFLVGEHGRTPDDRHHGDEDGRQLQFAQQIAYRHRLPEVVSTALGGWVSSVERWHLQSRRSA